MIFEAGQCPVLAGVHVAVDSLYSNRLAANQAWRTWLSPCSCAFPLGSQGQGPGQPALEGAGHTAYISCPFFTPLVPEACMDVLGKKRAIREQIRMVLRVWAGKQMRLRSAELWVS